MLRWLILSLAVFGTARSFVSMLSVSARFTRLDLGVSRAYAGAARSAIAGGHLAGAGRADRAAAGAVDSSDHHDPGHRRSRISAAGSPPNPIGNGINASSPFISAVSRSIVIGLAVIGQLICRADRLKPCQPSHRLLRHGLHHARHQFGLVVREVSAPAETHRRRVLLHIAWWTLLYKVSAVDVNSAVPKTAVVCGEHQSASRLMAESYAWVDQMLKAHIAPRAVDQIDFIGSRDIASC